MGRAIQNGAGFARRHRIAILSLAIVVALALGGVAIARSLAVPVPTANTNGSVNVFNGTGNPGDTVTLFNKGPFTIVGKCTGNSSSRVYIRTSQDHSAMDSYDGQSDKDFNQSDGDKSISYNVTGSSGSQNYTSSYDGDWGALSADLRTELAGAAWAGSYVAGVPCSFGGWVIVTTPGS
jgi:hypothetical protein